MASAARTTRVAAKVAVLVGLATALSVFTCASYFAEANVALAAPSKTATPAAQAAAPAAARWSGSTQFLQIRGARETGDGTVRLAVRSADIGGSWTEVMLSPAATNVPLQGYGGDAGQLLAALPKRTAEQADRGFDVTFDSTAKVTRVTWRYAL